MIKSEFSEKAFEMFVNHSLINEGYRLYIPSQVQEARLAYDALIDNLRNRNGKIAPFALQYKIVYAYMYPNPPRKFKFDLLCHTDSQTQKKEYIQHNILYKTNNPPRCFAGYAVPNFIRNAELYSHLNNSTLLDNVHFIQPKHEITDAKYHYYTFDNTSAVQHSPERHYDEICSMRDLIAQTENMADYAVRITDFIEELIGKIEIVNTHEETQARKIYPTIAYRLLP